MVKEKLILHPILAQLDTVVTKNKIYTLKCSSKGKYRHKKYTHSYSSKLVINEEHGQLHLSHKLFFSLFIAVELLFFFLLSFTKQVLLLLLLLFTLCAAPLCCASFFVPLQTPVRESSAKRTWPSRAQLTTWQSPLNGMNLACENKQISV